MTVTWICAGRRIHYPPFAEAKARCCDMDVLDRGTRRTLRSREREVFRDCRERAHNESDKIARSQEQNAQNSQIGMFLKG